MKITSASLDAAKHRLPRPRRRLPASHRLRRSSWTFGYNPASQTLTQSRDNDSYAWTGAVSLTRNYVTNGLNQYTAAGAATFLYDANGNLTSQPAPAEAGGTNSYLYDVENRLVSATIGAQAVSLRYDPMGRLYEVTGAATTRFLYDGDELIGEYSTAGAMLKRYVHGIAVDDPVIWYEGSGVTPTALRHLIADRQGSVIGIADTSGAIIAKNAYDEYGIPKSDQVGQAVVGRFAYTGQIWLPELGMYHYKARLYSPTLGRFMQTDPIGYDDQISLYAYVGNDPLNWADTTGLKSCPNGGCPNVLLPPKAHRSQAADALAGSSGRREAGANVYSSGRMDRGKDAGTPVGQGEFAHRSRPQSGEKVGLYSHRHNDRAAIGGVGGKGARAAPSRDNNGPSELDQTALNGEEGTGKGAAAVQVVSDSVVSTLFRINDQDYLVVDRGDPKGLPKDLSKQGIKVIDESELPKIMLKDPE